LEQGQAAPSINVGQVNPIQNPQILPISYAMPLVTARFSSPAASLFVLPTLLGLLFPRK